MNATMIAPPPPPNMRVLAVKQMEATLTTCLIERDDEVRAMIRCLIAQEHLFLEGPPGTAKSLLCSSLAQTISDASAFEVLLTKFSTPEDLFGPISVQGLKQDKYIRITDGYMPTAHVAFVDEALDLETPIFTPAGWRRFGDLQIGDEVFGSDGKPTKVVGLTEIAHDHDCYRVTFRDGDSLIADGGHLWKCRHSKMSGKKLADTWYVRTTRELHEAHSTRGTKYSVPMTSPVELPEVDLPVDPYVLGAWLGNGNRNSCETYIRPEWIDATLAEFHKTMPEAAKGIFKNDNESLQTINMGGTGLRTKLSAMGVLNNKHVPAAYLMSSIAQRLRLLHGLMDTDGYANEIGTCVFSTTTESVADSVQFIVRSLGYVCSKSAVKDDREGANGKHKQCFKVTWRPNPEHSPFLCRETVIPPRKWKNNHLIESVEPVESRPVRCIQVAADDHLFLVGTNLVLTHNCWKASSAILNTLLTIMQERRFDNGGVRVQCPLRIMIAASNEWPQGDELGAAFDRFLVRRVVRPVSRSRLNDLLFADLPTPSPLSTVADLDAANAQAMALPFSTKATTAVGDILDELADTGIMVGDRRKRKAMKIARAEAWLSGAVEVQPEHLEPLADVLWQDPIEQPAKALEIITRIANPQQAEVNRLLKEVDDIMRQVRDAPGESNVRESAKQKLQMINETANDIGTERAVKLAKYARQQWSMLCAEGLQVKGRLARMATGG